MSRIAFLAAILTLAGCAAQPEIRYVTQPLPIPPEPELPRIAAEEIECLGDDTYRKFVEMHIKQKVYIQSLQGIIRITHVSSDDHDSELEGIK